VLGHWVGTVVCLVEYSEVFFQGEVIFLVKSSPTTALAEVSTKRKVEKEIRNND
jgi:hypothetical protein